MYNCKCGKEFTKKSSLSNHIKFCDGNGCKSDKLKESWGKEWICPKCNFNIYRARKKHLEACDGKGPRRRRKRNTISEASKLKWQNKDYRNKVIKAIKDTINNKENPGYASTPEKEKARREKLSNIIKERYKNGWLPRAGRTKKIKYYSKIAGHVTLDGKWELGVALYLDKINVKWNRNTKRFKYINLKGNESYYTPDFYIEEWNTFIEVKGYERELDRCKWSQFKENLLIWKKTELKKLNII